MNTTAWRRVVGAVALFGLVSFWFAGANGQPEGKLPPTEKLKQPQPGCLQVVARPGEPVTAVVYDTEQKVLGVYHIDAEGGIELKGIRPIRWDLQMGHYNPREPFPEEIRDGLTR